MVGPIGEAAEGDRGGRRIDGRVAAAIQGVLQLGYGGGLEGQGEGDGHVAVRVGPATVREHDACGSIGEG